MKLLTPIGWKESLNEEVEQVDEVSIKLAQRAADAANKYDPDDVEQERRAMSRPSIRGLRGADKFQDYIEKKKKKKQVDETSKRDMMVLKFMSHDPEAGKSILAMGKKERGEKKAFDSGKKEIKRLKTRNEESEIDYEAFLEHVVMNYPELVEEFLNKDAE
jgi:hypothetical protein